ncbi:hypothetical protein AA12467_0807 [Gluconobacter sphaericus NBRC 12467]|nr:hypothetical protein AA12467_0807 [Gluconobacter sphaericus NBRC 12467]
MTDHSNHASRTTEPNDARWLSLGRADDCLCSFCLIQHSTAALIKYPTEVRDAEASTGPLDQTYTEPAFQIGNAAAEF